MVEAGAPPTVAPGGLDAVRGLTTTAADVFARAERPDLAHLARVALGRIDRPTALICVAGEFKQGKSSLVNELVGVPICPVDDDLATSALTLLHHADPFQARVHRRREGQAVVDTISPDEIDEWVSERGNPDNVLDVERVEIGVPSRFLERGPAVIDTPGAGGIRSGAATSVLAFLPFADALLFVTDASAELSAGELDYLARAAERCPTVLVCLTKTDICPEWRRIAELNRGHLQQAGLDVPIIPVSSRVRNLALERGDRQLNDESGFPELLRQLEHGVLSRVKELAGRRAAAEIGAASRDLAASTRAELAVLDDPALLADTLQELAVARERLDLLRGPGARWQAVLNDRVADLGTDVTHEFRNDVRALLRDADVAFEDADTAEAWKELAAALQQRLADRVGAAFARVDDAHADIRAEIVGLLRDEGAPGVAGDPIARDVEALFSAAASVARPADGTRSLSAGEGVDRGLGLLYGSYGGVMLVGIVSRLLPATAAAVLMSNPFTLGAGALFGAKHLRDQRARRIAAQRQEARAAFRAAVDQAQVEVLKAISDAVRHLQRDLRDTFTARIQEVQRETAETATRCEAEVGRGIAERDERRPVLAGRIADLEAVADQADALRAVTA